MVLGKPQTDPTLEWFLSHCHIHKYPSKSTLIHQGEKAETLYYIVKGSVAVLIKDEEGKEMILSYLNQGDFIGELGLFEEGQERSAWVRAKTACEVAEISYKKFRQLIQVNPDILMRLSAQMARRLQVTSEKVGNLAFLDVTGRIAQTLLNLAKQPDAMTHPDGMQIKITRLAPSQVAGSIFRQSRDSGVIWLWRKLITEDNRAWCLANRKQTRLSNGSCLIATFISTHPRARLFTRVKKRKRCTTSLKALWQC